MSLGDSGIVIGTARSERADAIDLVRRWFDHLAARDVPAAAALMASPPSFVISGGHRFDSLEAFVAFVSARYGSIRKRHDSVEACDAPGGFAIYVRGELSGEWLEGGAFSGVRWCDRLLVQSGRITDVQTWSDLAEVRSSSAAVSPASGSEGGTT